MLPIFNASMERVPIATGRAMDPVIEDAETELYFTFQPMVSVATGQCHGYQATARSSAGAEGLGSMGARLGPSEGWGHDDLFEDARRTGTLHRLDLALKEKALRDFVRFARTGERLFLGIDRRVLQAPDHTPRRTSDLLRRFGLHPTALCLEVAEAQLISGFGPATTGQSGAGGPRPALDTYRRLSYPIVLDRFGSAGAALMALHDQRITMVRLDGALTNGIAADERTRLFVGTLISLAHVMGVTVIAGGVASEAEFLACKQVGCDLVQGDFICPPMTVAGGFSRAYTMVTAANRRERRARCSDQRLLREELTTMPAVNVREPMATVFQFFRSEKEHAFLPILDDHRQPIGIIREIDLRDVIYSRYGKDLLHNKALHRGLVDFLRPCPVCDIDTEAEKILEVFSRAANPPGIILVDDFAYVGVLTAASLLRVINEKNLATARDQNPLTRLPGNRSINDHIAAAFDDESACWTFVYFDIDNFKPFNDRLGFRQGDRAILLFSELMRNLLNGTGIFLGHIGGDDFFASFRDMPAEPARTRVTTLLERFRSDAESLYDEESRIQGYIVGRGRDGAPRDFPLLSCSAALVTLPAGQRRLAADDFGTIIAGLKKAAKQSPRHIAVRELGKAARGQEDGPPPPPSAE